MSLFNGCLSLLLFRHRKHDDDSLGAGARCCFGFLVLLAQILLNGVMALVLYWVITFHSKDGVPFSWRSDPKVQFNLHPVLMIAGFIYFMGQGEHEESMIESFRLSSSFGFSHVGLSHLPVLPPHLEQVVPHHVPHLGHPLCDHCLHCRVGLAQPEDGQGWQPCSHPQLLQPPLLDGIGHHGPLCSSGGSGGDKST